MDGIIVKQPIGKDEIRRATEILKDYKKGKQNLEDKITKNEDWYKGRHWKYMQKTSSDPKPSSKWLFNTIISKHADFMDSYPQADILPREEGDTMEAEKLSSIIPVVLEQNEYEKVYSDEIWRKLKHGTGVIGIFWDPTKLNGMGDISIESEDVLNLYWEPGVTDIQQSQNFFSVKLMDNNIIEATYPQAKGQLHHGNDQGIVKRYFYDESISTDNKSVVIDWYYKKNINGKPTLQFCKFTEDIVLYATENQNIPPMAERQEPLVDENGQPVLDENGQQVYADVVKPIGESMAEQGLYDHCMYPFVFDTLYQDEGMPTGFGFVDICKDAQTSIDELNNALEKNALFNANPRYFLREDGGINEEEFADPNRLIVHVDGNLGEDSLRAVDKTELSGNILTVLANKIDEMKETAGNRDTSNGGSTAGVTAASAIAAMQEQSGKTSRDMIMTSYRAHKQVVNMVIELIRQFYDIPRTFRIVGKQGEEEFVQYSNAGLTPQPQGSAFGVDMGMRLPVFDIKVETEKKNAYSQLSQNELALQFYNNGFFNPEMSDQVMAALEMMNFTGKDAVVKKVSENGGMYKQMLMMQQQMLQMGEIIDKLSGGQTNMAGEIAAQVTGKAVSQPQGGSSKIYTGEEENAIVKNARERAAEASQPR